MIERFHRELLNFLTRRLGDRELAADLAQESFARVYAARASAAAPSAGLPAEAPTRSPPGATSRLREITEPRALLYTTARNLMLDHHRRAGVRGQVEVSSRQEDADEDPQGPPSDQPDVVLSGRQRLAVVEAVVAALPPRAREAFVLYKLEGMTRAEVGRAMGISVKTVESHLAVAMEACLKQLQGHDADGEAG